MRARGYNIKTGTMTYYDDVIPVQYKQSESQLDIVLYNKKPINKIEQSYLQDTVIMYAAGYNDKNEKMLYEDDIVLTTNRDNTTSLTVAKFFGGAFRFCKIDMETGEITPYWKIADALLGIEIMGNIHENSVLKIIKECKGKE